MPDVPKHSAGYYSKPGMDLIDLFIGAEGTLGIVAEIEIGLVRPRPAWFTALVFCDDESTAMSLVDELRRESMRTRARRDACGLDVAAIEYLDADSLKILREDRAAERIGVPLPVDAVVAVLIQMEVDTACDYERAAAEIALLDDPTRDSGLVNLCRTLRRHGVLDAALPALPGEEERRTALFALREAVPDGVNRRILEAQLGDARVSKAACDVIVPFDCFAESLARYRRIATVHGIRHAIWGHVSDGNVHPNLLPANGDEMVRADRALLEIGQTAIDLGGCPMSEHGTGRSPVKQELLRRLYGVGGVQSMIAVKRALDPRFVLAPGVLFGKKAYAELVVDC
jgi:D-lactate dehydrogenase (cytochrome)